MTEWNWGMPGHYPTPYYPVYNSYTDPRIYYNGIIERQSAPSPTESTYGSSGGTKYRQPNYTSSYEGSERNVTGYEGFLVPNPWFGILPWGAEGILIVVVAIVIILVVLAAIIYLFVKIIKLGIFLGTEYLQKQQRSLISNAEYLTSLTVNVWDSLDKYGDISDDR